MNTALFRLCAGLAAALLFSQCAATPQSRIQRNPQLYSQLSSRDRQLVSTSAIREGMTRDAVFLAWGKPSRVTAGASRGKRVETWTYLGQQPVSTFNTGVGFGWGGFGGRYPYWGVGPYGWGGWGGYPYGWGGPSVTYVPYTQSVVEFTNDRVTRWMTTPRS